MATNSTRKASSWSLREIAPALACTMLGTAGFGAYMALPMLLGALSEARGVDEIHLGWIGSAELVGLLIGSLCTAKLLGRGGSYGIAVLGIVLAIAANLATPLTAGIEGLIGVRVIAGFGGGLCYSYALARLSTRGDAARNASIFGVGLGLVSSLLFIAIPWLSAHYGLYSIFIFLSSLFVAAGLLLKLVPSASSIVSTEFAAGSTARALTAVGVTCLLAVLVWGVATACLWIYTERLGTDAGLTSIFVGQVLNISNLACMVSCLLAYRLTKAWGEHLPQIIILLICGVLCLTWTVQSGEIGYSTRIFIYFQLISITQVLQISLFGYLDRTGKLAALLPAAQGTGQALGPLVGSSIFAMNYGFWGILVTVGGLLILSAAIFSFACLKSKNAKFEPAKVL